MDVIGLNQRFIRDLIEAYRVQPALWKIRSAEYKDKAMKKHAYDTLIQKCRNYVHDADREFVRTKINSLRTSYRKEYKKVKASQQTATCLEEVYKPHLWYYDLLSFLNENDEDELSSSITTTTTFENDENDDFEDSQSQDFKTEAYSPGCVVDDSEEQDPLGDTGADHVQPPEKKSRLVMPTPKKIVTVRPEEPPKPPAKIEDVFDAIGKNVAHKLRGMTHQQRIIAEKIISDVMYHGQMENLTPNSRLAVDD